MTSVAETIFFPVRPTADTKTILAKATSVLKKHPGFKGTHYGVLVEDPRINCLVITWDDKDSLIAWTKAYDADEVAKRSAALIDAEAGLEPFATFIAFKHDPTPAFEAPVTEFGFFSLPDKLATEVTVFDKIIGPGDDMASHPVMTVGKAKGAATGFVFAVKPEVASEGYSTALAGVFGYDSVEDHEKWRETPEHAELIRGMEEMLREFDLKAVDVLGKRRAMFEGSGIVHVRFESIDA